MSTKEFERTAFNRFSRYGPRLPYGEIHHEDEPDFRIDTKAGLLGIEIRRVFRHTSASRRPAQADESERQGVLREAQRLGLELGIPPLRVSVIFSNHQSILKDRRKDPAESIARCVEANLPKPGTDVRIAGDTPGEEWLPREVDVVRIRHDPQRVRSIWHSPEAGYAASDATGLLQQAIDEKSALLPKYLDHVSECWLLLVAEATKPSGLIRLEETELEFEYTSPFARTYFMNTTEHTVHHLISF